MSAAAVKKKQTSAGHKHGKGSEAAVVVTPPVNEAELLNQKREKALEELRTKPRVRLEPM